MRHPHAQVTSWWQWVLGAAICIVGLIAVLRASEVTEFLRLVRSVHPAWLLAAGALQLATFFVQADVLRRVLRDAGPTLGIVDAAKLSTAKAFIDQAIPTGGLSSALFIEKALEHRAFARAHAVAVVAVNVVSYHLAYVVSLCLAIAVVMLDGRVPVALLLGGSAFIAFSAALIAMVLTTAGQEVGSERPSWVGRVLHRIVEFLAAADRRLTRDPRILLRATADQLSVVALDTVTLLALLAAINATAGPAHVFVALVVSSLVRSLGFVPGGLGTFEATAVLTLHGAGVPLEASLAATALFRGLTFWLPMIPGWWFARDLLRPALAQKLAPPDRFWSLAVDDVLKHFNSSRSGLDAAEAASRFALVGEKESEHRLISSIRLAGRQVKSPLLWLLLFATAISLLNREWGDATIVLLIVAATVTVGYLREHRADRAIAALRARIQGTTVVLRGGAETAVPRHAVVPGDIIRLSAGRLIPADALVLDATDCFVNEAALTGESYPVQKVAGVVDSAAPIGARLNTVFMGTSVRSGTAECLAVAVGRRTELGRTAATLARRVPETDFDRGLRRFGYLLTSAMLMIVIVVFVVHVLAGRSPVETLLFSVALAVGLSPELLPAILTVNLARGAQVLADGGVMVRRLTAIENLGSMTVLCTDKTGTITKGVAELGGAYDARGARSADVLRLASISARLQTGLANPIDDAIAAAGGTGRLPAKLGEVPFDFVRRRLTVVVDGEQGAQLITKGSFDSIVQICARVENIPLDDSQVSALRSIHEEWSRRGIRVVAIAERAIERKSAYSRADEQDMTFAGFVTFLDPPKSGVAEALQDLAGLGVTVKLITGDNRLVARHVAELVGLIDGRVLTGAELAQLDESALIRLVPATNVFAEVDPNQKERIILALKKSGQVVGFLGDGINDVQALHAADASLSVEGAVDVARETADFVLMDRDLHVIRRGVEEGRRTFANTLKYILTTTSANLGNMLSMAAASLVLPFLPLLPGQILLNNLLSDIPALGVADDRVDPEMTRTPPRWDLRFIGRFMTAFGLLSSVFDVLTFATLLVVFQASVVMFRTGWFVESLLTELVIALVVRTRRPWLSSQPGRLLLNLSISMILVALAAPYLPFSPVFGLAPLPPLLLLSLVGITVLYVRAAEWLKRQFYRNLAHA